MKRIIFIFILLIVTIGEVNAAEFDKELWSTSFETEEEQVFWDLTGDLDGDGKSWVYETDSHDWGGPTSMVSESNKSDVDNIAISNEIAIDEYLSNQGIVIRYLVAPLEGTYSNQDSYSIYIFKGSETNDNIIDAIKNNTVVASISKDGDEFVSKYLTCEEEITNDINKLYKTDKNAKSIKIVIRHRSTSTNDFVLRINSISLRRINYTSNLYHHYFSNDMNGWTSIDYDEDGYAWEYDNESMVTSVSYDELKMENLYPENYLISPKIKILSELNNFKFDRAMVYATLYPLNMKGVNEHYSIYAYGGTEQLTKDNIKSMLGNEDISQLLNSNTISQYQTYEEKIQLDNKFFDKEIQIVFVHHNSSGNYGIGIREVKVYACLEADDSNADNSGGETPPTEDEVVLGDWNGNGSYTLIDLIQYRLYMVNPTQISAELLARVDLTKDGKLSLVDLIAARKLLVGLPIN